MAECYLCGSDLADHGPPVCGPCNEMTARGSHGLSLDRPAAVEEMQALRAALEKTYMSVVDLHRWAAHQGDRLFVGD